MSTTRDVYVVSAARTAIGTFGGTLKDSPPIDLATTAIKAAIARSGADAAQIGHVAMGTVIPTEARDAYLGRVASVAAGVPKETPAFNVNRLCGSGLQAIISASQAIMLGDCELAIGAGAESMSRGIYFMPAARWGARMGDTQLLDYMVGILHDPFHKIHMGITAENVAEQFGITRAQMDALAVQSHQRAAAAIAAGRFTEQIVPVEIVTRKGSTQFVTDEHVKADTTIETLGKMRAAFKKDGLVTAGNASGVNDGAVCLMVGSKSAGDKAGIKPMVRIIASASAGAPPHIMGIGPVAASKKALARVGLSIKDMDIIEINEAFAAQVLSCLKGLEVSFDDKRVNPNGGAIALGHPLGASGARIALTAARQLQRTGGRYALVSLCIGGGQGTAVILERVQ